MLACISNYVQTISHYAVILSRDFLSTNRNLESSYSVIWNHFYVCQKMILNVIFRKGHFELDLLDEIDLIWTLMTRS